MKVKDLEVGELYVRTNFDNKYLGTFLLTKKQYSIDNRMILTFLVNKDIERYYFYDNETLNFVKIDYLVVQK